LGTLSSFANISFTFVQINFIAASSNLSPFLAFSKYLSGSKANSLGAMSENYVEPLRFLK
jgi:hypothetical protein